MAYYFKAFGLTIKSEYPFRNSKACEKGIFDVSCSIGPVPTKLTDPIYTGINFEGNNDEFILRVDQVANYYITKGENITISPSSEAELREIELFLLGSVMSVILLQRGIIPFHGSAFVKDNKAYIISGPSGSGKTSLLNFFIKQGFKALTDDVCALNIESNQILLTPSYPSSKIWSDVMKKMDYDINETKLVRPNIQKYQQDISSHFCTEPKIVSKIFILGSHNQTDFVIEPITGIKKFQTLSENLYRPKFPIALDKEKETFTTLNLLAQQVELYKLMRSNSFLEFDAFNTFVLEQISK